jgi:hypothetical protein
MLAHPKSTVVVAAMTVAVAAVVAAPTGTARSLPDTSSPNPSDFVRTITNEYLPLRPGTKFVYLGDSDGVPARTDVLVTRETKVIQGVTCTVVYDVATEDGVQIERTWDWYAQDTQGNVWYFGELSLELVNGEWVVSDGSWEAGVDGAQAGFIMKADPRVGDTYRQEYYAGHAEDMARVLSTDASVSVPYGTFDDVLVTREWTPLEPGVAEKKFYGENVGLLRTTDVRRGSGKMQLVSVSTPDD